MKHRNLRRYFRHGTLTQLSVFEAVARHSSFTRAAEEMHMAQPTVSVQVKKLAETIGLPLFEIVGKRVQLTAAGRELYAACQDIFLKIAEVEARMSCLRAPDTGSLRIAVSTTAKYFAPRVLARFLERLPGIEVSLTVLNRQQLLNRLAGNLDDFYIFSNPPEEIEVVMHTLLPNPTFVYARADHPLAARRGLKFADVAAEPFLLREPGSGTRIVAEQAFDAHRRKPNIRMELGSNEAIKQAILGGLGVSILSQHTMGPGTQHDGLVALDVEGFPLQRWWYLVHAEGKQLSPTAQAFLEYVSQPGALRDLEPGAVGQAPAAASR
jgi:LysR family transcriptional regulator, low CO2-responsive transcriptional regulator